MKSVFLISLSVAGLMAQAPAQPNHVRFQPTYDDVKTALGLTDEQVTQLKQLQQDKMAATQAFYSKMSDKQKELNSLLETGSKDAAHIGQAMLDLQTLRKQPPPGAGDLHDKAVAVLTADQKTKLTNLEEAQKLRSAVDQATQLALLNPPAERAPAPKTPPAPGQMVPMATPKPSAQ